MQFRQIHPRTTSTASMYVRVSPSKSVVNARDSCAAAFELRRELPDRYEEVCAGAGGAENGGFSLNDAESLGAMVPAVNTPFLYAVIV